MPRPLAMFGLAVAVMAPIVTRDAIAQSVTDIGTLPGDLVTEKCRGSDGAGWVVGTGYTTDWRGRAIRWSRSGGMEDLGALAGGTRSSSSGASIDGEVIVGTSNAPGGTGHWAFRWTAATGMRSLGALPGCNGSFAQSVSHGGSVVIGYCTKPGSAGPYPYRRGFRWTQSGGMKDLGTLPGDANSEAYDVSADGAVVVGISLPDSAWSPRAFRWTAAEGMKELGVLPGATVSVAHAVSTDGTAIVGVSGSRAFRWTAAEGMKELGVLPGPIPFHTSARDSNNDGSSIIGDFMPLPQGPPPPGLAESGTFIWRQSHGIVRLFDYLAGQGADLSSWQGFKNANWISPNSRYVVGFGFTADGQGATFLADLGATAPALPPPNSVTASDGADNTPVSISWDPVTGATGYRVLRSVGNAAAVQVGVTASTTRTFLDSTALRGTRYLYRVKAFGPAGEGVASPADPGWRNVSPPATVLATDGASASHVSVTWSGASGATGYRVFRTLGGSTVQVGGTMGVGARSYDDASAVRGTRYTYTVKAVTAAGDSAASAGNTGWRNVTVVASDGTSTAHVALAWSTVTGATSYKVFRSNGTATPATLIATVTSPSRNDTTAVAGVTYNYAVKAVVGGVDQPLSGANTGFRAPAAGMPTGGSAEVRGLGAVSAAMPAHSTGAPLGRPEIGSATDTGEGRAATGARAAKAEAIPGPDAVGERVEFLVEGAERPPVSGHRCDINEDGAVDGDDLDAWLAALHAGDPASCDLDGDGDVGPGDLELLLRALSPSEHAQRPVR